MSESKWTDERPTEPGDYWVSVDPKRRQQGIRRTCPAKTTIRKDEESGRLLASFTGLGGEICWGILDIAQIYDGAKWLRCEETPADPFSEFGETCAES